ncbi:MAG: hypothetical protein RIB60_00830 [Phycisphaerales bacterium]
MKTRPLILASSLALLAGCESLETTVEVRNESRRAVMVTIEQDVIASDAKILARETLGAGDARLIGPVETPPFDPAMLRVRVPSELGGMTAEARLPRGRSTAVIDGARMDSWGEVSIRVLETQGDADD